MYYVMVVTEGALEEVCGVTSDKMFAEWWQSGELGGLAPKRIIKEFQDGVINTSHKENRWEGPYKHVDEQRERSSV